MKKYKDVLEMCEDLSSPEFTIEVAREIVKTMSEEIVNLRKENGKLKQIFNSIECEIDNIYGILERSVRFSKTKTDLIKEYCAKIMNQIKETEDE